MSGLGGDLSPHAQRVHAGAALLDRVAPGWWRHVPVGDLAVVNEQTDVLALLARAGVQVSGAETGHYDTTHGMDVPDDDTREDSAYTELTNWWCWEIGVRVGRHNEECE